MRARNIKPGLYANELLAECSLAARLLFPGLWMMADREGRLEDRPKKIKAGVFPYDNFDTKPLLDELEYKGFIVRYEVQGGKYIEIINFLKHQKPHHNEKESEIPPRDQLATKEASTCDQGSKHLQPRSKALAPDSLIPDSLIPDTPILNSVPNGTGGKPPITDPDEIIFGYGVPMLTNAGTAEKQARSFLGGLRKHHGDAALVNKLRECARAKPLQPLEWLAAALPPAGVAPKLNSQEALEASNRAVAERFLAEEAAHEAV